jgi:hypothetical protein
MEPSKTGRYRFRPHGEKVVLQIEEEGIFGVRQRYRSTRWRDATPQDLIDLVQVAFTAERVCVSSS